MKVNVELLKKVRGLIAEEPRRLQMDSWNRLVNPADPKNPPCGTTACLAGWAVFAARPELMQAVKDGRQGLVAFLWDKEDVDIDILAARLLGVPKNDCPFYETQWGVPEVLAWIDRQIDDATAT